MTEEKKANDTDKVTPESLMDHFQGAGLTKMIFVTVVIHAVVLLGTSLPFLIRTVMGDNTAELSKEERVEKAAADATAALQEIADKHGLSPRDISERFGTGAPRKPAPLPAPAKPSEPEPKPEPEAPKSAIEAEIQKVAPGPAKPLFDDEEEDLFK